MYVYMYWLSAPGTRDGLGQSHPACPLSGLRLMPRPARGGWLPLGFFEAAPGLPHTFRLARRVPGSFLRLRDSRDLCARRVT